MRSDRMGTILKGFVIGFIVLGVLLATRAILFRESPEAAKAGTTVETVLNKEQIEIPEIDQANCENYSLEINNGNPFFTEEEIAHAKETGYYIELSECDAKKRAQTAVMCADEAHIRTEERDSDLSAFEPSGWHRNAIYERCHLLMWKLSGPDEITNLITGTEYFNQVAMYEHETKVTQYLWKHPEVHVLYRVTPYYVGEELLARGILMEAVSVEDNGAFRMCEFVYNAQPGSEITYESGAYHMSQSWEAALGMPETTASSEESTE